MVVVSLNGGLGNQLFQYAAARRIAVFNKAPLKLDISVFEGHKLRKYSLHHFNIIEDIASPEEVARFNKSSAKDVASQFARLVNKCKPYHKRYFIRERSFEFDPNILKAPGRVLLHGFWQSEQYFADIEDVIRREVTVKSPPDELNAQMAREITATNSVCLHVRRGDYVSDAVTHQAHGVCSLEYYHTAIEEIARLTPAPHFFVFSDDPQWTQANLKLEHPTTFVTHNDASRNYEDLRLMATCKHYIIANSSFSWWGAWLGTHPEKVVIAPKQWANDSKLNTKNRLPESWRRI
jgi:hypothetical protein